MSPVCRMEDMADGRIAVIGRRVTVVPGALQALNHSCAGGAAAV